MSGPKRAALLTVMALAAPLSAFAVSSQVTDVPPAALEVSTSLESCGVLDEGIACQLSVTYNQLANATSYSATVTRADGSVVDYGTVPAGGTSLWVPYVGSGTYSVRITAYGAPEEPGDEEPVISTEVSVGGAEAEPADDQAEERPAAPAVESGARGAGPAPGAGEATLEAPTACQSQVAPEPPPAEPPVTEPLPEQPPENLDPEDPDEDADGIDDAQERVAYEAALAERGVAEAAVAPQVELPESIDC